jgi:hypothetical protein
LACSNPTKREKKREGTQQDLQDVGEGCIGRSLERGGRGSRPRRAGVDRGIDINHAATDIVGNPRIAGRAIDLGPFEIL